MAHGELAWLFHEPHTGLEDSLNMLLSCFRKRMSDREKVGARRGGEEGQKALGRVWGLSRVWLFAHGEEGNEGDWVAIQ